MNIVYETKTSPIIYSFGRDLSWLPHMHKQLEIVYVKNGHTMAYADQKSYELNSGDVFITFPNQVHYYDTISKGDYHVLIFSPETIMEAGSLLINSIPNDNAFNISDDREMMSVFSKIKKVDGKYKNIALNGYYNLLMSMILPRLNLKTINIKNNSALYSITDFCSKNFKDSITLDSVAENLHLSKYYISHLINNKLNLNFNDYINSLRIGEACFMLKDTDMKIADISEDVGFGTIRSFNRSFKELIKMSPGEYRKNTANLKKLI